MADMIEPEELDAALARIRNLEIVMADMVDAEELEAAEARATEMEARAAALEVEADRLRARVRALEAEMAGMSYDDGEDLAVAPVEPRKGGTFKRRSGQFTMRKFDFAAVKAKAAPVKAFKRSGTFSLRRMKFSPKAATSALREEGGEERGRARGVQLRTEKTWVQAYSRYVHEAQAVFRRAEGCGLRAIHVQALGNFHPAQV